MVTEERAQLAQRGRVIQALQVILVLLARQVQQALRDQRVPQDRRETLVLLVLPARQALQETLVLLVIRAQPDPRAPQDLLAPQDLQAQQVQQALQDRRALQVLQAQQV